MALETPSRPRPFMANAILNFHFDYLNPPLMPNKGINDFASPSRVWTTSPPPNPSVPFLSKVYQVMILLGAGSGAPLLPPTPHVLPPAPPNRILGMRASDIDKYSR